MPILTISSLATFFVKLILPAIWIPAMWLATIGIWAGVLHGKNNMPPPPELNVIFPIMAALGTFFFLKFYCPLKQVRMDAQRLYISNFSREITVPFTNVKDVIQARFGGHTPIMIVLREDTAFGTNITFIPKMRYWGFWGPHPIVAELKRRAGLG